MAESGGQTQGPVGGGSGPLGRQAGSKASLCSAQIVSMLCSSGSLQVACEGGRILVRLL